MHALRCGQRPDQRHRSSPAARRSLSTRRAPPLRTRPVAPQGAQPASRCLSAPPAADHLVCRRRLALWDSVIRRFQAVDSHSHGHCRLTVRLLCCVGAPRLPVRLAGLRGAARGHAGRPRHARHAGDGPADRRGSRHEVRLAGSREPQRLPVHGDRALRRGGDDDAGPPGGRPGQCQRQPHHRVRDDRSGTH